MASILPLPQCVKADRGGCEIVYDLPPKRPLDTDEKEGLSHQNEDNKYSKDIYIKFHFSQPEHTG